MMGCQCRLTIWNEYTALGGMLIMGEARVRVEDTGETPYFPLNFAVHLKLLEKI